MKICSQNISVVNNRNIVSYKIINSSGFYVRILNLGGVVTDIATPDKNGKFENVVLKFEDINDYVENLPSFGAIVGRTAGRISKGEFRLQGTKYKLNINNNGNNLHGGIEGFSKKIWDVEEIKEKNKVGIKMYYYSKDGEENYPGNLKVYVTYWVTEENELIIEYKAVTDKTTIVNMTNHSYFNLSGNYKKDILKHKLFIDSDNIAELNKNSVPNGKLLSVKGTPFDFKKEKTIGLDINEINEQLFIGKGYDHPWILNHKDNCFQAELLDEESGRTIKVYTDRPAVVCYTYNCPNDEKLYNGIIAKKHNAVCLETQDIPDGINHEEFSKSILNTGEEFNSTTIFKFGVKV